MSEQTKSDERESFAEFAGRFLRWSAIIIGCLILLFMLLPGAGSGPASPRSICTNNLKMIGLALNNYHDDYDSFPPAYIADKNGRPIHSSRVLILPYMEQAPLYKQYSFDEPWDGPNNSRFHSLALPGIDCPASHPEHNSTETNYLTVVGPGTAWNGDRCAKLADFTEPEKTILVVESANSGIHWMEPRDLHIVQMARTINAKSGQGISSPHKPLKPGGANVLFADGHVAFLEADMPAKTIRTLLTVNGGEEPRRSAQ